MFDKQLLTIPGAKRAFLVCLCASVIEALLIAAQSISLAGAIVGVWSVDTLQAQLPNIAAFFAFFIARKAVQNIQSAFIDAFAAKTRGNLEDGALEAVFDMGPAETMRYGTAAIVADLIEGAAHVEQYLRIAMPRTIAVIVVPFLLLAFLFAYDWVSGVIALVMYPFIIVFMRLIGRSARAEAAKRHKQFERMSNNFLDTAAGVDTLSAFDAGPAFSESIFRASEKFRMLTMKTLRIAMLSSTVLDIFATLALAAVAIMLGFRLVEGTLTFLPALIVLMIVPDYFKPIKDYGSDYHATLDGRCALDSLSTLIRYGRGINAPKRAQGALGKALGSDDIVLSLAHVSYHYGNDGNAAGRDSSDAAGISNVNLELRLPCTVAIFGESGSGKTTLLDILAGFVTPEGGAIAINGCETETLKLEQWLRRVAYIPQSPYIFHASLRDNLAFYNPHANEREIERAAEAMGLHEFISELPEGLDTQIGEGGRALSGGQAQRVAVARALLDPKRDVWIFDEPTAHLDIETEYELKARLLPLMSDKLAIIATHRTHWRDSADICFSVSEGSIANMGGDAA